MQKPKLRSSQKKRLKFELSSARVKLKKALKNQYKAYEALEQSLRWFSKDMTVTQDEINSVSQAKSKNELVRALIHPDKNLRQWARARHHAFMCYDQIEELRIQLYGR